MDTECARLVAQRVRPAKVEKVEPVADSLLKAATDGVELKSATETKEAAVPTTTPDPATTGQPEIAPFELEEEVPDEEVLYVPLQKVHANVNIRDRCAEVQLEHTWLNTFDFPITTAYMCPLPGLKCAIYKFEARIGDQLIVARMMETSQADSKYDEAVAEGKTAFRGGTASDDAFKISIGNIGPQTTVTTVLSYVMELGCTATRAATITSEQDSESDDTLSSTAPTTCARFVLPTCLARRYGASDPDLGAPLELKVVEYSLTVDVCVNTTNPLRAVFSPTHKISTLASKPNSALLEFASAEELNRDFVLLVDYDRPRQPLCKLEWDEESKTTAIAVTLMAPAECECEVREEVVVIDREIILLLDRSGSMGDKIQVAKDVWLKCVAKMPDSVRVNAVSFGSNYVKMFAKSLPLRECRQQMVERIRVMTADLGGTEMRSALEDILSRRVDSSCVEPFNVEVKNVEGDAASTTTSTVAVVTSDTTTIPVTSTGVIVPTVLPTTDKDISAPAAEAVMVSSDTTTINATSTSTPTVGVEVEVEAAPAPATTFEPVGDLDILLITDGEIDESERSNIMSMLHCHRRTRVFTIGLGCSVSHALVHGVARASGGDAEIIETGSELGQEAYATSLDNCVSAQIQRMLQPSLPPPSLSWTLERGGKSSSESKAANTFRQAPHSLRPLRLDEPQFVYAIADHKIELDDFSVGVSFQDHDRKQIDVRIDGNAASYETGSGSGSGLTLHRLYAAERLHDLQYGQGGLYTGNLTDTKELSREIVELSLRWNVMSSLTQFLGVASSPTTTTSGADPCSKPAVYLPVPQYSQQDLGCGCGAAPSSGLGAHHQRLIDEVDELIQLDALNASKDNGQPRPLNLLSPFGAVAVFNADIKVSQSPLGVFSHVFRGPRNRGANCWMDAAVAAVMTIPEVRNYLLAEDKPQLEQSSFVVALKQLARTWVRSNHQCRSSLSKKLIATSVAVRSEFVKLGYEANQWFSPLEAITTILSQLPADVVRNVKLAQSFVNKSSVVEAQQQGKLLSWISVECVAVEDNLSIMHATVVAPSQSGYWLYDDTLGGRKHGFQGGLLLRDKLIGRFEANACVALYSQA